MVSVIELPSTANFSFYFGKVPIHAHARARAKTRWNLSAAPFAARDRSDAIRENPAFPFLGNWRPQVRRKMECYVIATRLLQVSPRCVRSLAILSYRAISGIRFSRPSSPSISHITIPFLRSSRLPFIKFTNARGRKGAGRREAFAGKDWQPLERVRRATISTNKKLSQNI